MIHPLADVKSKKVGEGTRIWQYSVVCEGAQIGQNCNINCHTFIEGKVVIGNNVTVKSGVHIWDGVIILDDVFIGPSVIFTNDLNPRSQDYKPFVKTLVKNGASLGAGSILKAGITVGEYSLIGLGAVVTKDVPDYALVYGNPARIKGWVDKKGIPLKPLGNGKWKSSEGELFEEFEKSIRKI